jgi:type I restriction enzyme S subunit
MSSWSFITLGELIDNGEANLQTGPFGTQLKAGEYVAAGIPVINVKNIGYGDIRSDDLDFLDEKTAERLQVHKLKVGDIVFGRKGSSDRHVLIGPPEQGWIQGSDCMRLRLSSNRVTPRFLSYYFCTSGHKYWMEAVCSFGATMTTLNQGIVRRITLRIPPLEVQNKIVAILSAYDELIENNKRCLALQERLAEEIYREWFVRGRFPGHEKVSIVKGVPQGWARKCLPEIADITYGFPFDGSRFNSYSLGKPIVRIRNISDSSTSDYTDERADDRYIVHSGDLLVGMDGEFHINRWYGEDAYLVQRVCRLKSKQPALEGYLEHAIRGPIKHFESILMGATVGHLGAMHLKNIVLLVPPEVLHNDLEILNDINRNRLLLAIACRNLSRARDLLLPRLICGKFSVENLDIQVCLEMTEELGQSLDLTNNA